MPNKRANPLGQTRISEDEAHRILARAAELEADRREGRSWQPTSRVADSRRRSLSERLAHYRRHSAVACFVGVGFMTTGDMVATLVLYSASLYTLYTLYEIAIIVARSRDRSGPSHSVTAPSANEQRGTTPEGRGADNVHRRLSLRPI